MCTLQFVCAVAFRHLHGEFGEIVLRVFDCFEFTLQVSQPADRIVAFCACTIISAGCKHILHIVIVRCNYNLYVQLHLGICMGSLGKLHCVFLTVSNVHCRFRKQSVYVGILTFEFHICEWLSRSSAHSVCSCWRTCTRGWIYSRPRNVKRNPGTCQKDVPRGQGCTGKSRHITSKEN